LSNWPTFSELWSGQVSPSTGFVEQSIAGHMPFSHATNRFNTTKHSSVSLMNVNAHFDFELRFYGTLNTKWVISETFIPANLLV